MRKIYEVSDALEGKITGKTPQVVFEQGKIDDNIIKNVRRYTVDQIKGLDCQLPCLVLNKDSKRTDWLNTFSLAAGWGRLISENLFQFLKTLKLPEVEYVKLTLKDDSQYNYYYFNILSNWLIEYIDFSKSLFKIVPGNKSIKVKDYASYQEELKKNPGAYIEMEKLKLKKDVFELYDVINLGIGDISWYTHEGFVPSLECFTGICIEEVNSIAL